MHEVICLIAITGSILHMNAVQVIHIQLEDGKFRAHHFAPINHQGLYAFDYNATDERLEDEQFNARCLVQLQLDGAKLIVR